MTKVNDLLFFVFRIHSVYRSVFFTYHTGDICHFSSMKKNIVIHCYSLIILRANSVDAIEDTEVKTKLQTYVKLLFINTKGILCNFVDVIIICR